jgi:hypothetical protein
LDLFAGQFGKVEKLSVTLPPGRLRLRAHPFATGSLSRSTPTMGIVLVAFTAAATAYGEAATITSHLSATNSPAK